MPYVDGFILAVPKAKLEVLHGVGHIPMIEDVPLFDAALWRAIKK